MNFKKTISVEYAYINTSESELALDKVFERLFDKAYKRLKRLSIFHKENKCSQAYQTAQRTMRWY